MTRRSVEEILRKAAAEDWPTSSISAHVRVGPYLQQEPTEPTDHEETERGQRAIQQQDRAGMPGVPPGDPAGRARPSTGQWTWTGHLWDDDTDHGRESPWFTPEVTPSHQPTTIHP